MKGAVHIYTTTVPPGPSEMWQAVALMQRPNGRSVSEFIEPIRDPGNADSRIAAYAAILLALAVGRKHGANSAVIYSDDPLTIEALNKRARVVPGAIGLYLQARAFAHSYRRSEFRYAAYPTISDLPVMTVGC
ncbi:MAG: hypothetical protein VB144_07145 [Clostridia bacterium]|nr:hypothetical protein [Clostridia bacterium]